MQPEDKAPQFAAFTLRVPLDREQKQWATFHIKEITEDVYFAGRALMDQDKDHDAVRMMIKALLVQPSDSVELLKDNFVAIRAAVNLFRKLLMPVEGELKKN